jgi:hypothetical protein
VKSRLIGFFRGDFLDKYTKARFIEEQKKKAKKVLPKKETPKQSKALDK